GHPRGRGAGCTVAQPADDPHQWRPGGGGLPNLGKEESGGSLRHTRRPQEERGLDRRRLRLTRKRIVGECLAASYSLSYGTRPCPGCRPLAPFYPCALG